MSLPAQVSVLIAGGGPVGLTAACLLRQRGIDCLVASRDAETSRAPRAHVINRRTMEVYRELALSEAITAAGTPPQHMRDVVWATTLSQPTLARYEAWGTSRARVDLESHFSPERVVNLPQHRLEPMLKQSAERAGADVRFAHEVLGYSEDADGVNVEIRTPYGATAGVRCRYLLAADGGRSRLRDLAGLKLTGEGGLRTAVSAYFRADLSASVSGREGLLYLLLHPAATGVLIGARLPDEWVFMYPLPPGADPQQFNAQRMTELIRLATGDPNLTPDIVDVQSWRTNALVADRYSRGRVFLAGDAAHLNSPTGGLGMNTGIGDVHNLTWKLAAVLEGWAGAALLDTYDVERRPIGRINIEQSLRNLQLLGRVREALGLPAVPGPDFPAAEALARLQFAQERQATELAFRVQLQNAVRAQCEQFDATGIDLGYVYPEGAVSLGDEDAAPPASVERYVPCTAPGARLPHATVEVRGRRLSTLDVVATTGFTLLHGDAGDEWRSAAVRAAAITGVPVTTVGIGLRSEAFDVHGGWAKASGLGEGGALLVRPDRHVAWRGWRTAAAHLLERRLRDVARTG